jgi:hypothetical protein
MKDPEDQVEKYFCNACQQTTRHVQRAIHKQRFDDPVSDISAWCTWTLWECLGCEEVMATECWRNSEDLDPRTGEPWPSVSFHPPRSSHHATKKHYETIPHQLDSIYSEVIQTFNTGAHILCAAGLRALLEAICIDREPSLAGPKIRLPQKIDGLKSSVPEKIVQNLHGFRFLGDKALHELEPPKPKELALAIEVMEDVLNVVYELDYKSGRLFRLVSSGKETPPREF